MSDLPQTSHAAPGATWRRGAPAGLPRGAGRAGVAAVQGGRRGGRWKLQGVRSRGRKKCFGIPIRLLLVNGGIHLKRDSR